MSHRFLTFVGLVAAMIAVVALSPVPGEREVARAYTPPRTSWGHPDLQGIWTSDGVAGVPIERPKEVLTEEDLAKRKREQELSQQVDRGANVVWNERELTRKPPRPPALVVDPPDGRIPVTREMQALVDAWGPTHYGIGIDSWEDLDLWDRCLTKGFPTVMLPMGYSNMYQILQTPDYVAILYEIIHDVRIIPLDGRPHGDQKIRQYWGDSRGRWEGDTLVVDVTNFSDKTFGTQQPAGSYRGGGQDLHIVERFTRVEADIIEYRARLEDPRAFTRPWTLFVPLVRDDSHMYEYACHEGNYGLKHILSAAFGRSKAAEEDAKKNR